MKTMKIVLVGAVAVAGSSSAWLDSNCYSFETSETRPRLWRRVMSLWERSSARVEWNKGVRHCY
jgi:hypothetical protein